MKQGGYILNSDLRRIISAPMGDRGIRNLCHSHDGRAIVEFAQALGGIIPLPSLNPRS